MNSQASEAMQKEFSFQAFNILGMVRLEFYDGSRVQGLTISNFDREQENMINIV